MDPVTVAIGVAAICYGVYTAWARQARPEQFWKLESMKRMWGERAGVVVHTIGYTVVPIVAGIAILLMGLQGRSLFGPR